MTFPFLATSKYSPQLLKKVTWPWTTWPKSHDPREPKLLNNKRQTYDVAFSFFLFPQPPLHQKFKMLQKLQFFLLSGLFLIYFLLVPLSHHESLLKPGKLPNKAYNLNTDYLASGWLFWFIFLTEYVLKFVYFLLVLIDCSKLLWISGKPLDITISEDYTNLVNGELINHSNVM